MSSCVYLCYFHLFVLELGFNDPILSHYIQLLCWDLAGSNVLKLGRVTDSMNVLGHWVDTSQKDLDQWNGLGPMRLHNKIQRFAPNTNGRKNENKCYLSRSLNIIESRTSASEVEAHKQGQR